MSKWAEYTLAVIFVSMVASLMYGAHYSRLVAESQSPEYLDNGCGGINFRPSVAL
jgi:hypothetical protein